MKLASLPYCAVMLECTLTVKAEVDNVAMPPTPTVPVPRLVAPSKNVTVPDGLPAPGAIAATVAVKVTDCPNTDGFGAEVRLVVVPVLLTTWVGSVPLLPLKLPSPPYTAETVCEPIDNDDVLNVATPPLDATAVGVPSIVKVTIPVGVPTPGSIGAIVAVKVTLCPKIDGFTDDTTLVVVLALLTVCVGSVPLLVLKLPSPL